MRCRKCHAEIKKGTKFCGKCGAPVSDSAKGENSSGKKSNIKKFVLGFGLIVVALGIAVFLIKMKNSGDEAQSTQNSVVEEENRESNDADSNEDIEFKNSGLEDGVDKQAQEDILEEQLESENESIDYASIVQHMKTCESVECPQQYQMMDMVNPLLGVITKDQKILLNNLPDEEKEAFCYSIICSDLSIIPTDSFDVGCIYDKQMLNNAMQEYFYGSNIGWNNYPLFSDKGETIEVTFSDGAPIHRLYNCDVKQEDQYYLISGPCFYEDNGGAVNVLEYYIDALFVKNEESRFGFTLPYVETYVAEKKVMRAEATSTLPDYKDKSYSADKLLDNNPMSPWVEGVSGIGEGEKIIIEFDQPSKVYGILLYNGYLQTEQLYKANGKVKKVSVDFGQGNIVEQSIYPKTDYQEAMFADRIELEKTMFTNQIVITILEAEAGEIYTDTCIGEIVVY